jgi:hypothetical protein
MRESTKNHIHILSEDWEISDSNNDAMTLLETAVINQDVMEFQKLVNEISWSNQSSSAFVNAIRMALILEAPLLARRLAEQGSNFYPEHQELGKMARILAPPQVITSTGSFGFGVKANKIWIDTNREEYKRKWVALKNGELIASGQTFSDLRAKIGDIKGKGILVTQVT